MLGCLKKIQIKSGKKKGENEVNIIVVEHQTMSSRCPKSKYENGFKHQRSHIFSTHGIELVNEL